MLKFIKKNNRVNLFKKNQINFNRNFYMFRNRFFTINVKRKQNEKIALKTQLQKLY